MNAFIREIKAGHADLMRALGIASLQEVKDHFVQHGAHELTTEVKDFFEAIDFSETFFLWLLGFHVLVFAMICFSTCGNVSEERLVVVCLLLTGLAFAAPWLNTYGHAHAYELFNEGTDPLGLSVNYFDEAGVFIAVFYWFPLVAQVLWLLARLLWRIVKLMAAVKHRQLMRECAAASKKKET